LASSRPIRATAIGYFEEDTVRTSSRGFAVMSEDKQREIASKGGKAAHASGRAHEWSSAEARDAGRKGGLVRARRHRARARQTL
jgi:general stress protein YciG